MAALPPSLMDLVKLIILVDEEGAMKHCQGPSDGDLQMLNVACSEASRLRFTVQELDDQPVPYLLPFAVRFSVTGAPIGG